MSKLCRGPLIFKLFIAASLIAALVAFSTYTYITSHMSFNYEVPLTIDNWGRRKALTKVNKRVEKLKLSEESYVQTSGTKNVLKAINQRAGEGKETPIILIWRSQKHWENDREKHLEFLLRDRCGSCQITMDRNTLGRSIAVVLFNLKEVLSDIPDQTKRRAEQSYVFWSQEPPSKTMTYRSVIEDQRFDTLFNLTMYYRRDSDIIQYFGNRELSLRESKAMEKKGRLQLAGKTKMALWLVSNCYSEYGAIERLRYARMLQESGLQIDKYGKCFGNKRNENLTPDDISQYKFYLSFENSIHCPDYVTEKFWRNSLQASLVPIVFGPLKRDVEKIAPKYSFIHAEDFESPKHLVDYLHYLDSNETAYLEYHKWRNEDENHSIPTEDIFRGHKSSFCRLCRRLVIENHPKKQIPSVSKWLYDTRHADGLCLQSKPTLTQMELNDLINF